MEDRNCLRPVSYTHLDVYKRQDYGEGKFDTLGLALITIRNGNIHNPEYNKPYAEKIMMCDSGQVSPMHYHINKMEDIINRGGNDIVFTFYNADQTKVYRTEDGREIFEKDFENDVLIYKDGRQYKVKAGEPVSCLLYTSRCV